MAYIHAQHTRWGLETTYSERLNGTELKVILRYSLTLYISKSIPQQERASFFWFRPSWNQSSVISVA